MVPQRRDTVWWSGKRKESQPGLYQPLPYWEVPGGMGSLIVPPCRPPEHGGSQPGCSRVCVEGEGTAIGTKAHPGVLREERLAGQV